MPALIIIAIAVVVLVLVKTVNNHNERQEQKSIAKEIMKRAEQNAVKIEPVKQPSKPPSSVRPPETKAISRPQIKRSTLPERYVVIDFETTGLDPKRDYITEIAAVIVEESQIIDSFDQLVKPREPIPDKVEQLTGITNEMVSSAPSINITLPKFMTFIGKDLLVGHNIDFDSKFLSAACQRFKIPYHNKVSDTLELSRRAMPYLDNHKLGTVCKALHIRNDNAHRAMSDVMATQQVFEILAADNDIKIKNHPRLTLKSNSYNVKYSPKTRAIQELQDLLLDITSDNKLTDDEVMALDKWIDDNAELCGSYPFDRIKSKIKTALEDGVLEQSELDDMLKTFKEICKPKFKTDISKKDSINVYGKTLVFTGECRIGDTEEIMQIFEAMGAVVRQSVSGKTDYLIVGDFGSLDWSYGNYGSEIAKAMELQDGGKKVKVVNETDFVNAMYSESPMEVSLG